MEWGVAQGGAGRQVPSRRNAVTEESSSFESGNVLPRRRHWCHSCQMRVLVTIVEETNEVECLACSNSFVEEMDEDSDPSIYASNETSQGENARSQDQNRNGTGGGGPIELSSIIQQLVGSLHQNTQNPMAVYLHGNNLPAILSLGGGGELASNLGDYHFGSGAALDALLNQLMQADPNNRGTPPASKEVIESLPKVTVTDKELQENAECAVCKDIFEAGFVCSKLPCNHLFCQSCIEPWLKEHNTCPVCRHELPTDDPDYERRRKARAPAAAAQNQSQNPRPGSSSATAINVESETEEENKMETQES